MFKIPIFEPWRPWWARNDELRELARLADQAAARRNEVHGSSEIVNWTKYEIWLRNQFSDLIRCRRSQITSDQDNHYVWRLAEAIVGLDTGIQGTFWPRWHELEDALSEASLSGNLLLGALVLRTQIEELNRFSLINNARTIAKQVMDGASIDAKTTDEFCNLALYIDSTVLFRTDVLPNSQLLAKPIEHSIKVPELLATYDELGDYVHPNYGSHLLFVKPESVIAAQIVCTTFVKVYEFFLNQCKVKTGNRDVRKYIFFDKPMKRLCKELPILTEEVNLPEITKGLVDRIGKLEHYFALHEAAEQIAIAIPARASSEQSGELAAFLVPIADVLEPSKAPHNLESIFAVDCPFRWPVPLNSLDARMRWSLLVKRPAESLEAAAEHYFSQPPATIDYECWFSLISNAILLTITLTELKIQTLAEHSARLLLNRNVLGAALSIRAIFEHHAVVLETARRLLKEWDGAAQDARNKKDLSAKFTHLENHAARFLAGTRSTKEMTTLWKKRWETSPRSLHVLTAIEASKVELPYGFLSKIIHGETYRGGDLLGAGGPPVTAAFVCQLIDLLCKLLDIEMTKDRSYSAMALSYKLAESSGRQACNNAELTVSLLAERIPEKFVRGRDIRGEGTELQPFRFRHGLCFTEAIHAYCYKENIPFKRQELWQLKPILGDKIHTEDGRILFFLNNPFNPKHQDTRYDRKNLQE